MPEDRMSELERRLGVFVERFERLDSDNVRLRGRVEALLEELEGLKRECEAKSLQLESLTQQRLEVRARVRRIREHVSSLEEPIANR